MGIEQIIREEISTRTGKRLSNKKKKAKSAGFHDEIAGVTLINPEVQEEGFSDPMQIRVDIKASASLEFVASLLESYRNKPMVVPFGQSTLQSKHISVKVFQISEGELQDGTDIAGKSLAKQQLQKSKGFIATSSQRSTGITLAICFTFLAFTVMLGIVFRVCRQHRYK